MAINPLAIATQGLLAPLAALTIATQGLLAGAQPVPVEAPPPDQAAVLVELRDAPARAAADRSAAVTAERRTAAAESAPARAAAPSTAIRTARTADAPTRLCVVPATESRTAIVVEAPERACAIPMVQRAALVPEPVARSVDVPFAPRTARVRQRGAIVARYRIFRGDSGNFDVQLLSGGAAANVSGATFTATGVSEDGTEIPLAFAGLTPTTGWVRHVFTAGASAGHAVGLYRVRVTATEGSDVKTFPGPGMPPIEFQIEDP